MSFNYADLFGRMRALGITQQMLAEKIGNTNSTLSLKLNNKAKFRQIEIMKICEILKIDKEEIGRYFFERKV